MIPYFMPLSLAQEILFVGKTVILFGFDPRKVKKGSTAMKSRPMIALKKIGDSRRYIYLLYYVYMYGVARALPLNGSLPISTIL